MANNSSVVITALLPRTAKRDGAELLQAIVAGLVEAGEAIDEIVLEGPELIGIRIGQVRMTALLRPGRLSAADYADYRRPSGVCSPAEDETAVDRLAAHDRSLVLSCGWSAGDEAEADRLFRRLVAQLAAREAGAVFLVSRERLVLTAGELETFLKGEAPLVVQAPARPPVARASGRTARRKTLGRTRRPVLEIVPAPLPANGAAPVAPVRVRRFVRSGPAAAPAFEAVANDRPDLPDLPRAELHRLRAALYPEDDRVLVPPAPAGSADDADQTLARRLSAVFMDLTLVIVALPVGAAVMTHNVLRGRTDLRLSARAMALTGAVMGALHADLSGLVAMI